ncbi:MAG: MerR family transcriptional regulator [Gemmatimonadota bacterium]
MDTANEDAIHPIGVAAARAGISPDLVRAWERRYRVVEPGRDDAGRRVYTSADIARLRMLARATDGGRSIGQVAELAPRALAELIREDDAARRADAPSTVVPEGTARVVEAALEHGRRLDAPALEALLLRSSAVHGVPLLLRGVLVPLFREVGELWHQGLLTPPQEHLVTATVRGVLARVLGGIPAADDAPRLMVATTAGERHEIGALLAAAAATVEGWSVTYLGADLPAADIAVAAREVRARAVAVSAVYAPSLEALVMELETLRDALPDDVTLLVGGAAGASACQRLGNQGIRAPGDLDGLQGHLRALVRR